MRGFTISWALREPRNACENVNAGARSPSDSTRPTAGRRQVFRRSRPGARPRREGRLAALPPIPRRLPRPAHRPLPPGPMAHSRLPAGITAHGSPYGGIRRGFPDGATELQPKVAPVATAVVQSTPISNSNPMVIGRTEGDGQGGSPAKGNGFSLGGTPRGRSSEGASAKRRRRSERSGGNRRPRPAHLSRPILIAWLTWPGLVRRHTRLTRLTRLTRRTRLARSNAPDIALRAIGVGAAEAPRPLFLGS